MLNTYLPAPLALPPAKGKNAPLKRIQVQYSHKENPFPHEYHSSEFRSQETERLRELAESAERSITLDKFRRRVSIALLDSLCF